MWEGKVTKRRINDEEERLGIKLYTGEGEQVRLELTRGELEGKRGQSGKKGCWMGKEWVGG